MKWQWKRWLGATLVAGGVVLVGGDAALRLVWGFGNPLLYRNDADAGYVVAPEQHVVRLRCHNDINQFGMRSPEVATPKPAGELRILMIGDSYTYGTTYVDQSQIFTSLLQRELPDRLGQPVEVLNVSAGGWAPGNEWGYLHSRGTFKSDWVFFVWNTGDLIQPFSESAVGKSPSFPSQEPSCAIAEVVDRYVLPRLKHQQIADAGSSAQVPDVTRDTPPNLAILALAKRSAEAAGAKFGVVYVPFLGPEWDPYAPGHELLAQWCQSQGTPLIDLSSEFATRPAVQLAFDNGHGHPRPAGHTLIAKKVADFLAARGQRSTPSGTTAPVAVSSTRP